MNGFFKNEKCDCCDKRSKSVTPRSFPDFGDSMLMCDECFSGEMWNRAGVTEENEEYTEFISINMERDLKYLNHH